MPVSDAIAKRGAVQNATVIGRPWEKLKTQDEWSNRFEDGGYVLPPYSVAPCPRATLCSLPQGPGATTIRSAAKMCAVVHDPAIEIVVGDKGSVDGIREGRFPSSWRFQCEQDTASLR